jgi:hypothetical protein
MTDIICRYRRRRLRPKDNRNRYRKTIKKCVLWFWPFEFFVRDLNDKLKKNCKTAVLRRHDTNRYFV